MKKMMILAAALAGLCMLSACDSETTEDSAATAETTVETSQTGKKLTLPAATAQVKPAEITAIGFRYSAEKPPQLDIGEKQGAYAAYVESEGRVFSSQIQIYAEDETLVEVSDITVKDGGLVNFYLTGKSAGTSKLYIATEDGELVSEPLEFSVRSEEEREYDETPVYVNLMGKYWHLSEECAEADGIEGNVYKWDNGVPTEGSTIMSGHVMETTRGGSMIKDKTPCPNCAAEETAQQDGEE